ncbi:MAG TPA: chromosomal replication initiator protein DnaA [Thermoanaerobaculia bacterium]|nr:chromosomal replication initiator protein DnaA [Thermoanaerobaculia bacterium]
MNVWSQLLARLEQIVDRAEYENWLAQTRFAGQKGDTLDIAAPSQRHIDEIRERFGGRIRSLLNELSPERLQVHFLVGGNEELPISAPPPVSSEPPVAVFNPRYRFESFVVGNSNQLAYAASLSIAENPSGSFNPLFIYGGSGLGKTHLIQAVGQRMREQHPRIKVVYMSADTFVTELITSIRYDRMQPFREKYRSADALLLDDIQSIAGKERTQEEFFHTFNTLYESQKQIVFTSDRPPRDITPLEERLRSRFEWGLTADIQPPDLETKIAILRKKAEDRRIDLSHDVAQFLAERVRNIRELEGNLNRVIVFASLAGQQITIDVVKEALKDVLSKENKPITAGDIIKIVAAQYGLRSNDLRSKTNAQTIVFPRQVAMYLCKELTDLSYPEIGKQFNNKHHSTVMHSVEKITRLVESDSGLANVVDMLTKQLR